MQGQILIVGQGLAGTWLSFFLRKFSIDFRIIDNHHFQASSTATSGLINPIVPKRLTKTWLFEELFPSFIPSVYREIEDSLGKQYFFSERKIQKLFFHTDDILAWKNGRNAGFQSVLGEVKNNTLNPQLQPHLGYAEINQSYWVNTPELITDYRLKLREKGILYEDMFIYKDVEVRKNFISYKGEEFALIIFCEGFQNTKNPWFNNLPMLPTKGEELIIYAPKLTLEHTVASGLHVIPLGTNQYSIGSTFRWDDLSLEPTEPAKYEILTKFKKIYGGPIEILNHKVGIRPATRNRRPFVGFHPQYKQIGILNGLGTKGLILAPLMSQYLVKNILDSSELPKECAIARYYK